MSLLRRWRCNDRLRPSLVINVLDIVSSAGVGRTGVFIALSILLERMRYEGVVDLFQTVKQLRTQRQGIIQSEVRALWTVVSPIPCRRDQRPLAFVPRTCAPPQFKF